MSDKYETNLLKPNSPFSRDNSRLILVLLIIWAVTVFGFQGALRILEKPTPEPALIAFEDAWPAYTEGAANQAEVNAIAEAYLTVLGKYVTARSNENLTGGFTLLARQAMADDAAFVALAKSAEDDPTTDTSAVAEAVGVGDDLLLARVVPHALTPQIQDVDMAAIPELMRKYMTHNRSILTDMRILGFPFHYFFTAVLSLIIFCLICLYYCRKIETINAKHGMEAGE
jgi:putative solute:sodium symporter small subunit